MFRVMIDDLYSARILTLAAHMPRAGRLELPHGTGEQVAKLCGSRAVVDVRIDGDCHITDFAQDVQACALGQAAASVIGEAVIGVSLSDLRETRAAMTAMLKFGGEGPTGHFEALRVLKPVADYPARHASALVALEATIKAVEDAIVQRLNGCVLGWPEARSGSKKRRPPKPPSGRTRRAGEA